MKCIIILSVNWIFHYSDNVQNSHALLHFPESKAIRITLILATKFFFLCVFFVLFCFFCRVFILLFWAGGGRLFLFLWFFSFFFFLHLKLLGYSLTIYTCKFDC